MITVYLKNKEKLNFVGATRAYLDKEGILLNIERVKGGRVKLLGQISIKEISMWYSTKEVMIKKTTTCTGAR